MLLAVCILASVWIAPALASATGADPNSPDGLLSGVLGNPPNTAVLVFPYSEKNLSGYRKIFSVAHENMEPYSLALQQAKAGLVRTVIFKTDLPRDTVLILADGEDVATTRISAALPPEFKAPGIVNLVLPATADGIAGFGSGLPSLDLETFIQLVFLMCLVVYGLMNLSRFSRSTLTKVAAKDMPTRFSDIAGQTSAKYDLQEMVEFMRDPERFASIGGRVPSGVLLSGPSGCGKTELARAVAGEASVPFFYAAGSDFLEIYAGLGSARMRTAFRTVRGIRFIDRFNGRWKKGGIFFIDEIDAIGVRRGNGGDGGGIAEREHILLTLLDQLDGMSKGQRRRERPIIVIGATNRPEILDAALLRPGRFDRQITVNMPDRSGRLAILRIHSKRVPLAADVDLAKLAGSTPGFSGASLANMVNEAAIQAGRRKLRAVNAACFTAARDRINFGNPGGKITMSPEQRKTLAVHEAGHALVALMTPFADPIERVTLVNYGTSFGHLRQVPVEDRWIVRKADLLASVRVLMGGRAAEELVYGPDMISTGASVDFQQALSLLSRMAGRFAMFPEVQHLGADRNQFSGGALFSSSPDLPPLSQSALQEFDKTIKDHLQKHYQAVLDLLAEHKVVLETISEELLQHETLFPGQLTAILRAYGFEPRALPSASATVTT